MTLTYITPRECIAQVDRRTLDFAARKFPIAESSGGDPSESERILAICEFSCRFDLADRECITNLRRFIPLRVYVLFGVLRFSSLAIHDSRLHGRSIIFPTTSLPDPIKGADHERQIYGGNYNVASFKAIDTAHP